MLFLMSECVSPANTGGLANVARALPAALQSGGRKAR
jgi:glycogen synthase